MKIRFTTYDIVCQVAELQRLIGMRVNQIYDIDNKTYLIRLNRGEEKSVLLLESGNRFHTTAFEWPKNVAPSGFTMKLRKHLKNKRLEKMEQLGIDRIVDFQFGVGEAAYHVIVELYDRGNIILTDFEMTILNILRPHVEGEEEVRFVVREKYPLDRAKADSGPPSMDTLRGLIENASPGSFLKSLLVPVLDYGPSLIEHILLKYDLTGCRIGSEPEATDDKTSKKKKQRNKSNVPVRQFDMELDLPKLVSAVNEAETILRTGQKQNSKGFIIQKAEPKPVEDPSKETEYFYHNVEYHPFNFFQNKDRPMKELVSFDAAVDEFYSAIEGQKIDLKTMQQEREALKKLSNVKKDHAKRLEDLTKTQLMDRKRADLISRNQKLVDNAILAIQSALASQMSWPDIEDLVKTAQMRNDPVASAIKQLKLESNHISLLLTDPYKGESGEDDENGSEDENTLKPMVIDIDLMLSAFSNARRYYDQKRTAAKKEQRTIDAAEKAMKSAEKKTQQTLKEVRTISTITKARKVFWFEKFYWFISSENYLVIGGRDGQQNELIVKRYMRASDIYVHAEIQGASSVVIRNPTGDEIPPKTLLEAGTMAISYSVAWDAKVVTSAYWVRSDQVSKTAPTGEYLGTGSFMIRGKKNFLPPCHLILGLSFLFRLEDSSIERHRGERKVRTFEEDFNSRLGKFSVENEQLESVQEEETTEINLVDSDEENPAVDVEKDNHTPNASDQDDDDSNFPDTHIKVAHDSGKVTILTNAKDEPLVAQEAEDKTNEEKSFLIQPLPPKLKQISKSKQKQKRLENEKKLSKELAAAQSEEGSSSTRMARGKRGKMKKIKEKYKDQDEEEREIRMNILKSSGKSNAQKGMENSSAIIAEEKEEKPKTFQPKVFVPVDTEDVEDVPAAADVEMLDSLTGCPVDEDEILFAVPVIAPYQTLQHYKFKVKLTPGTGRRGKAAKTALMMFMKDKSCSLRERDLLKGVKDESLARNIPGKVKLSAPQLQKFKK